MASFISSPPPSTTFPQSSKSPTSISGKNDAKPIENPFLVRGTPVARTNQPISKDVGNSGGGPSFSPRSPPALPLVPVNGLRNRKANQKAGSDPPKFSVYLGTGCDYGSTKTDMDEVSFASYDCCGALIKGQPPHLLICITCYFRILIPSCGAGFWSLLLLLVRVATGS